MRKKYRILFVISLFVFILSGCGGKKREVALEALQNENGDFQYDNLSWGMTKEETEKLLGISLENQMSYSEELELYMVSDIFRLEGQEANLFCEYKQGKLDAVSFTCYPGENTQQFWDALKEKLISAYGTGQEETTKGNPKLNIVGEIQYYFWTKEGEQKTMLQLTRNNIDGAEKYIELSVFKLDK